MKARKLVEKFMKIWGSSLDRAMESEPKEENAENEEISAAAQEQRQFWFETLVAATRDFHPKQKLGEGGFGPVYKGKLEDGREIAVKKLSRGSSQGKSVFVNEVKLLLTVQHRNVVNLLGYCSHAAHKLLVYEFVSNNSLDKILFKEGGRGDLDWKRRYDVIDGVARGLSYLHEDCHCPIIHRDIKASNILLDEKWVPKIADFGMARLYPEGEPHVKTRVAGTSGYMAPEYAMRGELSIKADVYSFGVLILELISGKRNLTFYAEQGSENLLRRVWKLYKQGRSLEIMDPTLASTAMTDQVLICIQIGLLCTQADPNFRPTMRRVVVMLTKKPGSLNEPTRPGYPGKRYKQSPKPSSNSGECYAQATATATSTSTSNPNTASTSSHNVISSSSQHRG